MQQESFIHPKRAHISCTSPSTVIGKPTGSGDETTDGVSAKAQPFLFLPISPSVGNLLSLIPELPIFLENVEVFYSILHGHLHKCGVFSSHAQVPSFAFGLQ